MKTKDINNAKEVLYYIAALKETAADRLGIEQNECYFAELKERSAARLGIVDEFTMNSASIIEAYIEMLEFRFVCERAGEDMIEVSAAASLAADALFEYVRRTEKNSLFAMFVETLAKRANDLDNVVMEEFYEFSGVIF